MSNRPYFGANFFKGKFLDIQKVKRSVKTGKKFHPGRKTWGREVGKSYLVLRFAIPLCILAMKSLWGG